MCILVACRSVKASHVLISADGRVCMSGLRSIFSLIRHGQRARVVHDFPQYSVKVLPWLSPEVLQQVVPLVRCSRQYGNGGGDSRRSQMLLLFSEPSGL